MKPSPMLVSVVVTALDEQRHIASCLESLINQTYPSKEIIVVDGGSTDRTIEIVSNFGVQILRETKEGPAAGRNRGIIASKGGIVAFTDADCVPEASWLQKIMDVFRSTGASVVGGSIETMNRDNFVAHCVGARFEGRRSFATWNVAYRREVIEALGLFDERLITGEDLDLALKAEETGHPMHYEPTAKVQHCFPTTVKDVMATWFWYGFYWPRLLFRHPSRTIHKVLFAFFLFSLPVLTIVLPPFPLTVLAAVMLGGSLLYYAPLAFRVARSTRSIRYVLLPFVHSLKLFVHLTGVMIGLLVSVGRVASH